MSLLKRLKTNPKVMSLLLLLVSIGLIVSLVSNFMTVYYYNQQFSLFNDLIDRNMKTSDMSLGFSCGLLSEPLAKTFLGAEEVTKRSHVTPYNAVGLAVELGDGKKGEVGLNESCAYDAKSNNSKYVSLTLISFSNSDFARQYFERQNSKQVNETTPQPDVDSNKLVYSLDGYKLLKGSRIYTVAASDGNTSNNQTQSKQLFDTLLPSFQ